MYTFAAMGNAGSHKRQREAGTSSFFIQGFAICSVSWGNKHVCSASAAGLGLGYVMRSSVRASVLSVLTLPAVNTGSHFLYLDLQHLSFCTCQGISFVLLLLKLFLSILFFILL